MTLKKKNQILTTNFSNTFLQLFSESFVSTSRSQAEIYFKVILQW